MSRHLVFVDGQEGTTGLRIHEMLALRSDIEVLRIDAEKRKDPSERSRLLNEADVAFLCLPDAASREASTMLTNPKTCLIDASTAFRTHPDWVYGLPELSSSQRVAIKGAKRVSNPGCHATAFILLVRPLVEAGLIPLDLTLSATSLTGYSGGGRSMIEEYESSKNPELLAPRPYALTLTHKHLPEMVRHSGLNSPPIFVPIVGPFYKGLTVTVSLCLRASTKKATAESLWAMLSERYTEEVFVRVRPLNDPETLSNGFFNTQRCNDSNRAELFVFAQGSQVLLMACIDNLGKGASGAAIQNMNLVLGCAESSGLTL